MPKLPKVFEVPKLPKVRKMPKLKNEKKKYFMQIITFCRLM